VEVLFKVLLKIIHPITPEINDAINTISFALFATVSFLKASIVIKTDIVKPMPAIDPMPKI
jgi:hypothetical protein